MGSPRLRASLQSARLNVFEFTNNPKKLISEPRSLTVVGKGIGIAVELGRQRAAIN